MTKLSTRHVASVGLMLAGSAISTVSLPAHAGLLDSIFGNTKTDVAKPAPAAGQRRWVVRENSEIRLVPREAGSQPNQQPARIGPETLRQRLGEVRFTAGGSARLLFSPDEAGELAEALTEALAVAAPDDDVLLVSSARRNDALYLPVAVTARLFVQSGALQFIVHDARFDFYDKMRGSNRPPEFSFGSRTRAGDANLLDTSATVVRADWLAIPLTAAAATVAPAAAVAMPAPAAPAAPTAAPAVPVAPAVAAPSRAREPGFADEVEQRLITLKRLRDRGLISEDEYQQKRKEILQSL